jgi:hypothetical protein
MAATDTLRDAAYITVGAAVLAFQKAQVRRRELTEQWQEQQGRFSTQIEEGRRSVSELAAQLDELVAPVRTQVEAGLDAVEERLPVAVRDAVKQLRTTFEAQERAARSLFGMSSAA